MKILVLLLGATAVIVVGAADKAPVVTPGKPFVTRSPNAASSNQPPPARGIIYRPPSVGAPKITTGPGTRGAETGGIAIRLLTPEHIALTTMAQPRLYWHHSALPPGQVEITLVEPLRAEPLLQCVITNARSARIEQIALEDHGVELKPDVIYRWSVAWVVDPEYRSKDLVAMGAIRRTSPLTEVSANKSPTSLAAAYAAAGIWYDALSSLMSAAHPDSPTTIAPDELSSLLAQVGLTNIVVSAESQLRATGTQKLSPSQ